MVAEIRRRLLIHACWIVPVTGLLGWCLTCKFLGPSDRYLMSVSWAEPNGGRFDAMRVIIRGGRLYPDQPSEGEPLVIRFSGERIWASDPATGEIGFTGIWQVTWYGARITDGMLVNVEATTLPDQDAYGHPLIHVELRRDWSWLPGWFVY